MTRLMRVATAGMLALVGAVAQAPEKNTNNAATASPSTSASNQDANIQAYVQLLRTDLNKTKSQIISSVMQLDANESAVFWPIYRDFQTDLGKIGDQIVAMVNDYVANYDKMTDAHADQLATKLLSIQQQRNELKRKYYEKFKKALDPVVAAEFLQVENQIENLVDLQIASQLPIVGTSGK